MGSLDSVINVTTAPKIFEAFDPSRAIMCESSIDLRASFVPILMAMAIDSLRQDQEL